MRAQHLFVTFRSSKEEDINLTSLATYQSSGRKSPKKNKEEETVRMKIKSHISSCRKRGKRDPKGYSMISKDSCLVSFSLFYQG